MIDFAHFCALITFTGCFFSIVSPDTQGDALLLLRTSLNASTDHLSDWNQNGKTPFGWSGITCDEQNLVTQILLASMGLSGTLSPGITILKNLKILSLRENFVTGKIPKEYGNLTNLMVLDLQNNHLIGEIPHSLGNLKKLESLFLNQNDLTGAIPDSLSDLSNLLFIGLDSNRLTGQIPNRLFHLAYYNFGGNQLNCGTSSAPPCASDYGYKNYSHKPKIGIVLGVVGSVIGLLLIAGICLLVWKGIHNRNGNGEDVFVDVIGL